MAVSFSDKLKTFVELLFDNKTLSALISQKHSGYLKDIGWFESFNTKLSIDKNSSPIPWTTYPFIDFISNRLTNKISIFEYGSGNSTMFWSLYVKQVVSVEHDKGWFETTKKVSGNSKNIHIIYAEPTLEKYVGSIKNTNQLFDIIMIDAIHRNECLIAAVDFLTEQGLIILDDSERLEYSEGIQFLKSRGFKELPFWGIAPTILFKKCTTIFYKDNNCLGI
ncbi:MAG TPA: FkbM family methyltransferase [Bacteroidetes bacterium]|nr:FkbM family methyltransferase [Bacteroidota bacterium]HRI45456.1 hypothetical protein [Ignavibacteriaceae bacterium]